MPLKTRRSRRSVPLRSGVVDAIRAAGDVPASGLVFATGGTPLDRCNAHSRGGAPRSLRAGLGIYQLARRMGTSVEIIDDTYAHLAADALEHELALLDAFDDRYVSVAKAPRIAV